ncbi:hypothetical protein SAMN05216522_10912 [Rosenbergiella nectarea]|uniref:Uncharacterized protein n=1 Tax=Rosenbergiella nectarea TaxID=988801 RepID=A0A1H9K826_9GAMM|nr:hypothetical protein SAMN05216522_10912 [Rosenbergiella nectarea]
MDLGLFYKLATILTFCITITVTDLSVTDFSVKRLFYFLSLSLMIL